MNSFMRLIFVEHQEWTKKCARCGVMKHNKVSGLVMQIREQIIKVAFYRH